VTVITGFAFLIVMRFRFVAFLVAMLKPFFVTKKTSGAESCCDTLHLTESGINSDDQLQRAQRCNGGSSLSVPCNAQTIQNLQPIE
jgi:hypothetical protein